MNLTPKERVLRQINHQETDPVPYVLRYEGDVAERLDAHYGSDGWRYLVDSAILRLDFTHLDIDKSGAKYYTDLYGSTWKVDHRTPLLTDPALKVLSIARDKLDGKDG